MEGTSTEEVLLKREIEDLPVVSSLCFIHTIGRDKSGYRVNLFCDTTSSYGGCTDGACTVKRVGPVRMSTKHHTMRDCLRALLARIQQDHGSDCVVAVQHGKMSHQQTSRQNVLWMREMPRATQMTC
jgi:hypothetical protein